VEEDLRGFLLLNASSPPERMPFEIED